MNVTSNKQKYEKPAVNDPLVVVPVRQRSSEHFSLISLTAQHNFPTNC
jgi:hypothetical protein